MPRAARRSAFKSLPLLLVALTILPLSGCGDDPVGPGLGLPTLSGVITRPQGDWLMEPRLMTGAPDGRLYVLDAWTSHPLRVFDPEGHFERALDITGDELAVSDERIYALDVPGRRVDVYDRATGGKLLDFHFEAAAYTNDPGTFGIAVTPTGTFFLVDPVLRRVQRFDADGHRQATWGERGTGLAQFESPVRIVPAGRGSVYVLDVDLWRLQLFNEDGQLIDLAEIPRSVAFGTRLRGELAVNSRGEAIVVDGTSTPGRVSVVELIKGGGLRRTWDIPIDAGERGCGDHLVPWTHGDTLYLLNCPYGGIARLTFGGERLEPLAHPYGDGPGEFTSARSVTVNDAGEVGLFDSGGGRFFVYGPDGLLRNEFPLLELAYIIINPFWGGWLRSDPTGGWWYYSGGGTVMHLGPGGSIDAKWTIPVGSLSDHVIDLAIDRSGRVVFMISSQALGLILDFRDRRGERTGLLALPSAEIDAAPIDLEFDASGHPWVLYADGILRIHDMSRGNAREYAWPLSAAERPETPRRIALGAAGQLAVLDREAGTLFLLDQFGGYLGRINGPGDPFNGHGDPVLPAKSTEMAMSPGGGYLVLGGSTDALIFSP